MPTLSRRTILRLLLANAVLALSASSPLALGAEGGLKVKVDVVGQFVDLLSDLLKLTEATTTFVQKQTDRAKASDKAARLTELQKSLTLLSFNIQDSLHNGSNPTLQEFQSYLDGPGPHDLGKFAEQIGSLAEMTQASIAAFGKLPTAFATDPSFGKLLAAQSRRLLLFRDLSQVKGKATAKDVRRMKEALKKWAMANQALEHAVEQLNASIKALDAKTT